MNSKYLEDQTFTKIDFKEIPLAKGEYDHCHFLNCDFSNSSLSEIKFNECKFEDCNLSLVRS
jgi:fluoroquinolone resistance protein